MFKNVQVLITIFIGSISKNYHKAVKFSYSNTVVLTLQYNQMKKKLAVELMFISNILIAIKDGGRSKDL